MPDEYPIVLCTLNGTQHGDTPSGLCVRPFFSFSEVLDAYPAATTKECGVFERSPLFKESGEFEKVKRSRSSPA